MQTQEQECQREIANQLLPPSDLQTTGCPGEWDGIACWPQAHVGETSSVTCPSPLLPQGLPIVLISRNCTSLGWTNHSVSYEAACYLEDTEEETEAEDRYFSQVKLMYTVGYGVSLGSLCIAMSVFLIFRRLLCTRVHIHLNLFSTFILRAVSVFVKDAVLFEDPTADHCTMSTVTCKVAVTFFHYCIFLNFFWLLVEGLYLHTLLIFSFANNKKVFWSYTLIGWGIPSLTTALWIVLRSQFDDVGCWDDTEGALWWMFGGPILISVCVNFILFMNILRIIGMKTRSPDSSAGDKSRYRQLTKATLLLIPLFGLHYIIFAFFPHHVGMRARFLLELVIGSFQGFIVALLYCFLNAEVQSEIRKAVSKCQAVSKSSSFNMVTQDTV
ncbi:growth hormone releasing hormone receptor 2 [Engraulis encrasicolus]|uniref:growth hormone releasing hormone receptor 2 n=1 Tax=Engraulis encrasicolus TaxID=184585 RepID=UPI002FD36E0A